MPGIKTIDYSTGGMLMPGRNFNAGDYRFGFNGKENDNEVKGLGNSLDFGARLYDPRLGRWLSIDPEFKKYPYSSPYVAFGNNPIYYVDPGGETLRVAGDEAARATAQAALQKLTNDKVTVLANGIVQITKGNENPDKKLVFGTQLLKALNENKKTGTINLVSGNNKTYINPSDAGKEENGIPVNAQVDWNPNETEGGVDVNGNTSRPAEIGLGHELIHGILFMTGKSASDDEQIMYGDPDNGYQDAPFGTNEFNTRLGENELRKEQGLPERKTPIMIHREGKEIIKTKDGAVITPPASNGKIEAPKKRID